MKKSNVENLNKVSDDTLQVNVVNSDATNETVEGSPKIQRRPVPPPTWPKIPEGAAGTAAAFGAWKTVTHSGRKI